VRRTGTGRRRGHSLAMVAVSLGLSGLAACASGHSVASGPKLMDSQRFDTSDNWSGYVAARSAGEPLVGAVNGQWRVPAVDCPSATEKHRNNVAVWVGLGGTSESRTLYQTGTTSGCNRGRPIYYAWWEVWPVINPSRPLPSVAPGDEMVADVHLHGPAAYFDIYDLGPTGQGKWVEGESYPAPSAPQSAECIVENPDNQVNAMPWFGKVTFSVLRPTPTHGSSCTAQVPGDTALWILSSDAPAPWPIEQLGMMDSLGNALTYVSDPRRDGPMTVTEAPNCRTADNTCS
jgi:hypothetical protein